ncbi:hypothetical protein BOX15_Mlig020361g2 [Macrostomum lignano]|uniref:G patch domain-containing protein 4 n=1 Tax=Macrostomum lignano TaxID=282301 RepID=A0A267FW46_9PLAT|nr:hypothetical protein BOX15_Mlig020361g1 [Macrostomum lignano]PAA78050.1 hypothetical protein BOX15_Mlig020361g2 [Macrostomum lignano]
MSGIGSTLLKKMGWKEGTAIGKSGNGIVEPIKPKLKIGTEGMGFKESERLCSGWWMDAFNRAAGASASPATATAAQATAAPVLGRPYGTAFSAASAVLCDGREQPSGAAPSPAELPVPAHLPRTPSDADLLAACGGRTAHCAARFGLSLSGKLARVRAQDLQTGGSDSTTESAGAAVESTKKSKKAKKRRREKEAELETPSGSVVKAVKMKRKRTRTPDREEAE